MEHMQPEENKKWKGLTEKQVEANDLLARHRNVMLAGGARSGKTFLLTRACLVRALRSPGSRHAILRFRRNAVRASIWLDTLPKVMELCFPGLASKVEESRNDGFVQLPNKSQIWFGGLDDDDRAERVLGQEYVTIYFNEASQIPYSSYLIAKTRLAQVCEGLEQREYVDLNPAGTAHWTYRQFVLKLDPETRRPLPNPDDYAWMLINPENNRQYLTKEYLASLERMPERNRRRFYEGQFTSDITGALWPLELLDKCRVDPDEVPDLQRVVVAIDPSGTSGKENTRSDAVGIVVAGRGVDGKVYVLEDLTVQASPAAWGRIAVEAYKRHKADRIIAERNFGGAMVEHVIKTADRNVPYREVTASRGKVQRAEPVAQLFEAGDAKLVGRMPQLEEQLANFSTAGYLGDRSPDRADACIWAVSELMLLNKAVPLRFEPLRI